MPSATSPTRTPIEAFDSCSTHPIALNTSIASPITTAFAIVPKPGGAPPIQAIATMTSPTTTAAVPSVNGVCSAMPMCSTSHGGTPSPDSSMATIATATNSNPTNSAASRSGSEPRSRGASFTHAR